MMENHSSTKVNHPFCIYNIYIYYIIYIYIILYIILYIYIIIDIYIYHILFYLFLWVSPSFILDFYDFLWVIAVDDRRPRGACSPLLRLR